MLQKTKKTEKKTAKKINKIKIKYIDALKIE